MANKVGHNIPTLEEFNDLKARLESLLTDLKKFCVGLSSEERTRVTRPRLGGEAHVPAVLAMAQKNGISVSGYPTSEVESDLVLARLLAPLVTLFRAGTQLTEDTINTAESEYWEGFLSYYGVLSSLAARDPEIERDLKPIVDFMATGRRAKRKEEQPG